MNETFKVVGFFKTSIGTIVVLKLPNRYVFLNNGMILNNEGHSKWRIIGVGMGKKPDFSDPEGDWILIMDYRIEHINGAEILKEGDILHLE